MSEIVTETGAAGHTAVGLTTSSDEADHRPPASRWRLPAAWATTTLMFLTVTKGPVFRVRLEVGAHPAGDFIDDRWVQAMFMVVAMSVLVLCLPARHTLRADPLVIVSNTTLVAVLVVSASWSVNVTRTLEQGVMMAVGTAAALLAGATLGRFGLVGAIAAATHAGVALSLVALGRDWPLVTDRNGDLAGIYFNRNSLGPVALTAAACAAVLTLVAVRRRRFVLAVPTGALVVVDLWVWWRSGSLTPVFALVVAVVVVGVFVLTLPGPRERGRRQLAAVGGGVAVVGAVAALALRGTIADRLDRSPTLSGRTEIWDVVLQFVSERPVHGWGFLASWTRPDINTELDQQYGREVYEAHSGYFEVLLGAGVIGLVAMVAVVAVALSRVGATAWRQPDALGVFLLGTATYVVAVNLGETYVGANLLPWTVLAATTGWAVQVHRRGSP